MSFFIYLSDATVWKFESQFGFRFSSSQNRSFNFRFKKKNKKKLKTETVVSVFGFGLESKTGCLCLLLRSMPTSYYVVVITDTLLQKKSENQKLIKIKKFLKKVKTENWLFL